jgi:hypothetical protein
VPRHYPDVDLQHLVGERALFQAGDIRIDHSTFSDGESPLKHAHGIAATDTAFEWKYPLWYASDVTATRCTLLEGARSGIWYTHDITITDSLIAAPKIFRRSSGIVLTNVQFPNATETLWQCDDVTLHAVMASGDYFGMNSSGVRAFDLRIDGNYLFDGGSDIVVEGGILNSRDAFWNCHDVVVRNATIIGEYLGWNSRNLTFENCTIESLQPLCYIDGLVMRGCRLVNTTLAFEYSTIDVQLDSRVDSVINPSGGILRCQGIGELIQDDPAIDPGATTIIITEPGQA